MLGISGLETSEHARKMEGKGLISYGFVVKSKGID